MDISLIGESAVRAAGGNVVEILGVDIGSKVVGED